MERTRPPLPPALCGQAAAGMLSHAYILTGGDDAARADAAVWLAAAALCSAQTGRPCGTCRHCRKVFSGNHPDVARVRREKDEKEIRIRAARSLRSDAAVLPNEADGKVYIIEEADTLNIAAQNALLKVLEEPPAAVTFLLSAANPARLLPTVRSRCTQAVLSGSRDRAETDAAAAFFDSFVSGDSVGVVTALFALEKIRREELPALLASMHQTAARLLRESAENGRSDEAERFFRLSGALDRAERFAEANVSTGHIMGLIMAASV